MAGDAAIEAGTGGTRPAELPSLTALRGVAALLVVLYHLDMFLVPGAGLSSRAPWLAHGYLGVDLFFLLSGFVIAHVYGGRLDSLGAARRFMRARVARLYPLHLVTLCVLGAGVAASPFAATDQAYQWRLWPLSAALLQNWAPQGCWNYPAWSIGDEFVAYIVFVFAAGTLMQGRRPRAIALLCLACLVACCSTNQGHYDDNQLPALLRAVAEFTLGALLYRFWRARPALLRALARLGIVPAAALAAAVPFDPLWLPALAAVLVIAVEARGGAHTALNTGPLLWLGNLSFSIYMWHAPIHIAATAVMARLGIDAYTLPPRPALLLAAATLATIFAVSAAGYRWIEIPARRRINDGAPRPRPTRNRTPVPGVGTPTRPTVVASQQGAP